jgi:hypothetical protein
VTVPDSVLAAFDWLPPAGWVWIPGDFASIRWQRPGDTVPRTVVLPAGYRHAHAVRAAPDGQHLLFYGENSTLDSMRFSTISTKDSKVTEWATLVGEGAWPHWLGDNTVLLDVHEPHRLGLYRVKAPGQVRRVGEVRLPVIAFSISHDMRRAVVATREYRGDIWMSRVVRR